MVDNKKRKEKTTLQGKTGSDTKPRISSYDYRAWDKFDVVSTVDSIQGRGTA